MPEFASEGFDLDALASATNAEEAVLELGGKVVVDNAVPAADAAADTIVANEEKEADPLEEAENLKQQGNEAFKQKEWQQAYELYSQAIQATPGGMTGTELLKAQHAWQEEYNQKMREKLRLRDELDRKKKKEKGSDDEEEEPSQKEEMQKEEPEKFVPPPHPHGRQLAVYYCNRAAASMQLAQQEQPDLAAASPPPPPSPFDDPDDDESPRKNNPRLQEAVHDCSIALLWNPVYGKAWLRRATVHERLGDTESALRDAREAQKLEPHSAAVRMAVARLQKLEDERLERLKTETLDKLKDLGNSILGNFGLSMDNFNAQKDPNTGSYSISFNQGGGGGNSSG